MGFLIRMAFWFSLVLLVLPLGTDGTTGVNPIQAFFAAKEAVEDMSGICERKPEVCNVGRAAMETIGARAKESARMAYEMLEDKDDAPVPPKDVAPDDVGALIGSDGAAMPASADAARDAAPTGSVTVSP
jgi:hypothetical protein